MAFFVTECKIWPPSKVFDVPLEELRIVGAAIAKKKGEEQKFLAMLHGAKVRSKTLGTKDLDEQLLRAKQKGFPVEVRNKKK